jgi:Mn2+/Fe2+ NRAMP family transporter
MRVAVYTQTDVASTSVNWKNTSLANVTSNPDTEGQEVEYVDMANGWIVASLGWLIWALIAGLNIYLIVMLGLGRT